ncbi:MAG: RNA polymerase sigma factor [Saprospiraceae bacterium]
MRRTDTFYRCTSDRTKSEDLIQNTFIRVINYKDKFKGEGEFSYWLYFIARNTWIDDYRKSDPMNSISGLESEDINSKIEESNEEENQEMDYKKQLEEALQKISFEKRDAIVLSRYHGLTYKIIAEMSDCSENTVKSRVKRGIVEIKNLLQKTN